MRLSYCVGWAFCLYALIRLLGVKKKNSGTIHLKIIKRTDLLIAENELDRNCKSSHRRYSVKRGVLKNFPNFTGKHLCWSLFLIKL